MIRECGRFLLSGLNDPRTASHGCSLRTMDCYRLSICGLLRSCHLFAQRSVFRWIDNPLMAGAPERGAAKAQALLDHFGRWVEVETGMFTGLSIRKKAKTK